MDIDKIKIQKINSRNDLNSELGLKLWKLCLESETEVSQASKNLNTVNWQNKPETLLYCLYKEKRFDEPNGCLFFLDISDEIVAVGGVYRSEFAPEKVAIVGVRTYTSPKWRNNFWHGEHLIPAQIEWAKANGFSQVIFTVNYESQTLLKLLDRASGGRAIVFGLNSAPIYSGLQKHEYPIMIKGTAQHIYKLNLIEGFELDYSFLKAD